MRIFGLIGYPLAHSFSKKYFTEKFAREKILGCRYELFPLKNIAELPTLIRTVHGLAGLNVTIPYKEQVIPFLNELDETAERIGAVNCIKIQAVEPFLKGYNTDVYGFKQSIKPFLQSHHSKALILGTGGASKAVEYVLKGMGIDTFKVSRNPTANAEKQFTYTELNKHILNSFTLIVNTSPLGTYPNTATFPEIPYQYLSSNHFLYDLVYNPEETLFLKKGKQFGAFTMNGLSMLHLQAEKAWEIFNSSEV